MLNILIIYFAIIILLSYITYESFNNVSSSYLVSLEKDKERRENLYRGITPKEYSSVDGTKLIPQEDLIRYNILENKDLKKGEIGCYMSHYNILEKIKNYNEQYSLILEDDVVLDIEKEKSKIENIIANAPNDWEIIFIGHNLFVEVNPTHRIMFNNMILSKINKVHGTQSYIIKNSAIRHKIQKLYPIKEPIDITLPKIFTSYAVEPKITSLSNHAGHSNTQSIN